MVRDRVLVVSADLPAPADSGGRIVTLRSLQALATRYSVDLVAFHDPVLPDRSSDLGTLCESVVTVELPFTYRFHRWRQLQTAGRSVASPLPYRLLKFASRAMHAAVRNRVAAGRYRFMHHEQLGAALYRVPGLPASLLHHNVEFDLYNLARTRGSPPARWWATLEAWKLTRREIALCRSFDRVLVLSDRDAALLAQRRVPNVHAIPVAVPSLLGPPTAPPPGRAILWIGSLSWFGVADGLRWFHDQVWPRVTVRVPDASWQIAGAGAPKSIASYGHEPGIQVLGAVEDAAAAISAARVVIVPLRVAGGIRIKLLEAFAAGRPAVATSIGASGIDARDGEGVFRRDDPQAFADALVGLLSSDESWRSAVGSGWGYVTRYHSPQRAAATLLSEIEAMLARSAGS